MINELLKEENTKLKKENDLLKEELKVLKDEITTIYYDMISLNKINDKELNDVEEL